MASTPSESSPRTVKVRISPDVMFRELTEEAVILDLNSQCYFGLDSVATRAWQLLREKENVGDVVSALLEEYDVEEARLRKDVDVLLEELEKAGLIEVL